MADWKMPALIEILTTLRKRLIVIVVALVIGMGVPWSFSSGLLRVVTHSFLARNRKYALLSSAVIAAFHADLVTMFVIMVPLYTMYEVSVWTAFMYWQEKNAALAA